MILSLRVILLMIFVAGANTQATAQDRLRIAWAGSTPSNTPIWVADQKGFFAKNGLSAEVINISASTIVQIAEKPRIRPSTISLCRTGLVTIV